MEIVVSGESWKLFLQLVDQWKNQGLWRFEKELHGFAAREAWDWMPLDNKQRFHRWSLILFQAVGRLDHHSRRREQRDAARFVSWVYRCHFPDRCPPEHLELNGIVLPPSHDFWARYLPPNGWGCGCDAIGCSGARGAKRLGGDPDKPLPVWWHEGRSIEPEFDGRNLPSLERVFELLAEGFFD